MEWVIASFVVVVIAAAAIVASGRWGAMPRVVDDRPPSRIPAGRLSADDIEHTLRFSIAKRGYDGAEVDALLDAVARELRLREQGATSGEVSAEQLETKRFRVVAWGYRPLDVDAVIDRLAEQLSPPGTHAL